MMTMMLHSLREDKQELDCLSCLIGIQERVGKLALKRLAWNGNVSKDAKILKGCGTFWKSHKIGNYFEF